MARKKDVYKIGPLTEGKKNIIAGLLQEYDIQSAEDIQDALKDLLGGTIKQMLESEKDDHLGYDKYVRSLESNYHNGTQSNHVRSKYGEFNIDVLQDRQSSSEPKVVPKRQKDISAIDDKIISMYAKGMSTRQISDTAMRVNIIYLNIYIFFNRQSSEKFQIFVCEILEVNSVIRGIIW